MAYVPSYTADNLADVTIDILVGVGVALVAFTAIIGLIMLFNWVNGKPLMKGFNFKKVF